MRLPPAGLFLQAKLRLCAPLAHPAWQYQRRKHFQMGCIELLQQCSGCRESYARERCMHTSRPRELEGAVDVRTRGGDRQDGCAVAQAGCSCHGEHYTHALKSSPHASSEEGGVKASCSQSSFLVTTRSHTTHARPQPNEILRTVQLSRSMDPSDPAPAALRRRRTCSQTGVFIDTWRLLEK